jgi:putative Holliday junction resolvase
VAAEYILALDYGEKRVGVAIAHQIARLPRPLTTVTNTPSLLDDITELISKENVARVTVGLPRGMDGGYTQQTRDAEKFADELADKVTVPVTLTDETLTSVDAESYLGGRPKNKGEIDAVAAAYILERYLNEHPTEGAVR